MPLRLALLAILAAIGCTDRPEPERFVLSDAAAGRPTTAVDPRSGDVYWTWIETSADGWNALVSRAAPDGRPGEPVVANTLERPGPHDQAPPRLAIGPDGAVYLVFSTRIEVTGRMFPASDLMLVRSNDGGRTFSREVAVNDDAGGAPAGHTFHDVEVMDDGTILVSWIDSRDTDHHADGSQIVVARSTNGGRSFSPAVVVDSAACPCCRTDLAVDGDRVYLGWRDVFENGSRDMVVARSDDGGQTFGDAVRVHADEWRIEACPHAGPSLAVDGAGRLFYAWYTGAADRPGLYYAVSEDEGRSFDAPVVLVAEPGASKFAVGSDGAGLAFATWALGATGTVLGADLTTDGPEPTQTLAAGRLPTIAIAAGIRAAALLDGERAIGLRWHGP